VKGRGRRKAGRDPIAPADSPAPATPAPPTSVPHTPPTPPAPAAPPSPPSPPGQRLYDMPYSSSAPRLVNHELGLHHLIARAGHNAGYDIDLTLLDAPDHRLIRSGVLLAHRVLEGRGEWYLGAPDWVPLLPKELIESMSQADLSEEMANLIRPFRRRAPLTPVAALRCERREFALRDGAGATVALLRDDKVTVRRGGLTTARYREVMLTPVGPGLDQRQADWLDSCLTGAGAAVMPAFPRLVRRLGAPATGPTDFPEPAPVSPEAPFSSFVASVVARRLRQLLTAHLRLRCGDQAAAADMLDAVRLLRLELDGMREVLDAEWASDLIDELDWFTGELGDDESDLGERMAARLRGERYLSLLDRLVFAARGGKLGDVAAEPTGAVLNALVTGAFARMSRITDRLTIDGPARGWQEAEDELNRAIEVEQVVAHLHPEETANRTRRLASCLPLLEEVRAFDAAADEVLAGVDSLTPQEAFALGREFERTREQAYVARDAFLARWGRVRRKLAP
jgi:hypothetical protein